MRVAMEPVGLEENGQGQDKDCGKHPDKFDALIEGKGKEHNLQKSAGEL